MKSNRLLLLVVATIFSFSLQAQGTTGWLTNLKIAQTVAQSNKKLILVDFWASWCGPCKQMDADVWSTQEAATIKKNFVPVKIDIDVERSLAAQYSVRSIPMLLLMDHKGEVIHTYLGYSSKKDLLDFISNIPVDATTLYEKMPQKEADTFEQTRSLGLAMQELSQQTDYAPLQRSFLGISDKWFKRSTKLASGDRSKADEIALLVDINEVHKNNTKKVIKEIEENRASYENTPNESLMYYVLLQAYKKNGDTASYEYALSKLREREDGQKYLSLLK